jgi:O-antigen/teichoic acid export membrane protein
VSLYDFGSRPLSRIRGLPLTAASALVPAISALDAVDNVERINAALDRATRYTVYFALPLFGFLVCFAGVLVEVWLGPGFAQSALTMRILAVAFFVNVCTSPLGFISQGRGQPGYQMYATLLQICLNVVLSTLLVLWFGFFGAVAGTTTSVLVGTLVFYRWYGKKLVAHPFQLLMAAAGRPLAAFTVAAAFALAVHFALTALVSVAGRIALGAEILAIGSLFLVLYLYVLRKSGAINADDRRFLENILPRRFHGITHFL